MLGEGWNMTVPILMVHFSAAQPLPAADAPLHLLLCFLNTTESQKDRMANRPTLKPSMTGSNKTTVMPSVPSNGHQLPLTLSRPGKFIILNRKLNSMEL